MANVEDAEGQLTAARKIFLESDAAYEAAEDDRDALKKHADRFIKDPDPNRSKIIRAHAERAKQALDQFNMEERFLVSGVASALLAAQMRIQGYAVKALQQHFEGVTLDLEELSAQVSGRVGKSVQRDVFEPAKFFALAATNDLNITAKGIEGAALLVDLHVETVRLFLKKHVNRDLNVILDAIAEIFTEDAEEALIVAIWETLKEVAPEVAREIAPFARAASLMVRLKEKVLGLHVPFRKAGPEDAILDLPLILEEQVTACEAAREMIRSLGNAAVKA